jgi:hypothetical protein
LEAMNIAETPQQKADPAAKGPPTRKREQALVNAYFEKFGPIGSFAITKENIKAIKSALTSGVDHVDLVRQPEEREA